MLDEAVANGVPDAIGLMLKGDDAARAQARIVAGPVADLDAHGKGMSNVGAALVAAPAASAELEPHLGVPAEKFLLGIAKRTRID